MKIEADVELAGRTTLGVGGSAAHYTRVESEAELLEALAWASDRGLPVRVLGGGSNIVVNDDGVAGLVLDLALRGVQSEARSGLQLVRAAAGEPWDPFVQSMVSAGAQGLECLSGIPGRVGATPIQNVGAYGQDVSETITEVVTVDTRQRTRRVFSKAECEFSYRDSFFKSREPGRYVVTEVVFELRTGASPPLRYAELERWFAARNATSPSLAEVRAAVLELRRSKSMLIDASDPNSRSCGSFFVNPVLSAQEFAGFSSRAKDAGPVPHFPQPDGRVKLSAGWLIERAGLPRGTRDGTVGLSTQHALALVAHEGATAADIARLAERIQRTVYEHFGIRLEPEPVFW